MSNVYSVAVLWAEPDGYDYTELNNVICETVDDLHDHLVKIADEEAFNATEGGNYQLILDDVIELGVVVEHNVDIFIHGSCAAKVSASPVYNS